MGNAQMQQYIQDYKASQNLKGLRGPIIDKKNRLYYTFKFYDYKLKYFILDKIYYFNSPKFDRFTDKVEKNYKFYHKFLNKETFPFYIMQQRKSSQNLPWIFSRQELKYNLRNRLQSKLEFSQSQIYWVVTQILMEVALLHEINLPHANLSPSNILLTNEEVVYLTDFGLFCPHFYLNQDLDDLTLFNPTVDKQCFLAPEIFVKEGQTRVIDIEDDKDDTQSLIGADMFSLGCIIYQIVSDGKILFNHLKLKNFIKTDDYEKFLEEDLKIIKNEKIKKFLLNLLTKDTQKRLNAKQALQQWQLIFCDKPDLFFIYFQFYLRNNLFSYADHQVHLVSLFIKFCKVKNIYNIDQDIELDEQFDFENLRIKELFLEIKTKKFNEIFFKLLNKEQQDELQTRLEEFQQFLNDEVQQQRITNKNKNLEQVLKDIKTNLQSYKKDQIKQNKDIVKQIISQKGIDQTKGFKGIIFSILSKQILYKINFINSYQNKILCLHLLDIVAQNIPPIEIIIYYIPIFIHSLTVDQHIPKIQFLRSLSKIIQNVKFINDQRFCKQHSVENYIHTLVDKILSEPNYTLFHIELINNLENYLNLNMIFNVSYVVNKYNVDNYKDLIKQKDYIINSQKMQNFFIIWIKKMLETIDYHIVALRKMPLIFPYLSKSVISKNINPLILHYLSLDDSRVLCLKLIPYIFKDEYYKYLSIIPIIEGNLVNSNNNLILTFYEVNQKFINQLQDKDYYFIKQILIKSVQIFKCISAEFVLEIFKLYLLEILNKFTMKEINIHFQEPLTDLLGQKFSKQPITFDMLQQQIDQLQTKFDLKKSGSQLRRGNPNNFLKNDSFFQRNSLKLMLNQPINIIEEIYKFLFSVYTFELVDIKNKQNLTNIDLLLIDINLFYKEFDPQTQIAWDFSIPEDKEIDFSSLLRILKQIKIYLKEKKTKDLNRLYNIEIFLRAANFFEEYIKNFNLENYVFQICELIQVSSSSLRQMKFKGNLVSTIFDCKSSINCITNSNQYCFQVGTEDGNVITYNLNNIKKNVPSLKDSELKISEQSVQHILGLQTLDRSIIVSNDKTIHLHDIITNKVQQTWSVNENVTSIDFIDPTFSNRQNSFITTTSDGDVTIFDIRQKQRCNSSMKLNSLLGVPKSICSTKIKNQCYISTLRGYLIRFDLKTNQFNEIFQLRSQDKSMPILQIKEFIPVTTFQNFTSEQDYLILTYPSNNNEFSIFNVSLEQSLFDEKRMPKLQFCSDDGIDDTGEILNIPYLQLIKEQKIMNFKQNSEFNSSLIFNNLFNKYQNMQRDSVSYIDTLKSHFEYLLNQNKINAINSLMNHQNPFFNFTDYIYSINKLLSVPNLQTILQNPQISIDNIILTAGDDRNIRFLNFGNDFKKQNPLLKDFGVLDCFHIANQDFIQRKYEFYYSSNMCIVKEQAGRQINNEHKIEKIENTFGMMKDINEDQNGLSEVQNLNFGTKLNLKQKSYGKSMASPTHSLPITDISLFHFDNKFYLISGSEDGLIKIWS